MSKDMPIHVHKRDSHSFNQNFTMFFTCRIRPMCPKATWYHSLRVMGAWRPLYKDPLANCGLALDISRDLHRCLANCATTFSIVNKALSKELRLCSTLKDCGTTLGSIVNKALSKHLCLCLNHKNCGPALSMGPCINIRWTFVVMQQVFLWENKFEKLGFSCYFLFWVFICFWSGDGFPSRETKMC
jgi:hypothetical protein